MTNAVSRQNSVCLGSSLSMRSFAIEEPGSPVPALYVTLGNAEKNFFSVGLCKAIFWLKLVITEFWIRTSDKYMTKSTVTILQIYTWYLPRCHAYGQKHTQTQRVEIYIFLWWHLQVIYLSVWRSSNKTSISVHSFQKYIYVTCDVIFRTCLCL